MNERQRRRREEEKNLQGGRLGAGSEITQGLVQLCGLGLADQSIQQIAEEGLLVHENFHWHKAKGVGHLGAVHQRVQGRGAQGQQMLQDADGLLQEGNRADGVAGSVKGDCAGEREVEEEE